MGQIKHQLVDEPIEDYIYISNEQISALYKLVHKHDEDDECLE